MHSNIYTCTINRTASSLKPTWIFHNQSIQRNIIFKPTIVFENWCVTLSMLKSSAQFNQLWKTDFLSAQASYMPTFLTVVQLIPLWSATSSYVCVDRNDISALYRCLPWKITLTTSKNVRTEVKPVQARV